MVQEFPPAQRAVEILRGAGFVGEGALDPPDVWSCLLRWGRTTRGRNAKRRAGTDRRPLRTIMPRGIDRFGDENRGRNAGGSEAPSPTQYFLRTPITRPWMRTSAAGTMIGAICELA